MSDDPWLTLPLDGLRLVEASAGTGKTFTLATLFTRLIVERELSLPQILAVTFTEAATQELRTRIRERLLLAVQVLTHLPREDDTAVVLTRAIVQRHLQRSGEPVARLSFRLRRAVEDADLASIFTIHSFCARVLREHALDSGQSLIQPELIANPRELYIELATDLWRSYSSQHEYASILTGLWKDQAALAGDMTVLAGDLPLRPEPPKDLIPNPQAILDAATQDLAQSISECGQTARALIADAFDNKRFDGRKAKRPSYDKAFIELDAGLVFGGWPRGGRLHIDKLSADRLAAVCKPGATPPSSPLFDALQAWCDADDLAQRWRNQQKIILLHRLRDDIRQRLGSIKQQRQIQTYDDLIDNLVSALQGGHAETLAERLRMQYRFALVDEFQDTDPRQWKIFRTVFAPPTHGMGGADGLFLIGDPKQAIYGFRGGDIHTYLNAKSSAIPTPPLNRNFRSRPSLLRALGQLYENAGGAAFGSADIQFTPILPGGQSRDEDYLMDRQPAPALTICRIESDGAPMNAEPARAAITAACVADIHRVLTSARNGRAQINGMPVQPGDIAVLVRNHKEATRIREALAAAGIPAVAAGRKSIFATEQAHELRLLLLALLHPANPGRLRTALASVLLGEDTATIAALDTDLYNTHHERLMYWRQRWRSSGIFAMLSDICADQAPRLLTLVDGERRLTNTLQLGEILQQEDHRQPGLYGLVTWLETRIAHADDSDDAQQLRLESDARCVQIVTLHKSKGLEYPLVYLPFVGIGTTFPMRPAHCITHDGHQRILHWNIGTEDEDWAAAIQQAAQEDNNETARLIYVGLTRAKHALWIGVGEWKGRDNSPLTAMLQHHATLFAHPDICLTTARPALPPRLLPEHAPKIPPPRNIHRRIYADWWVYSFTQLAHSEDHDDPSALAVGIEGRADDESELVWPEA